MSLKVRMTSKRQVTFPAAVCETLAVYPGDTLVLKDARIRGKRVWLIEPQQQPIEYPWMGALRGYAEGKASHDMSDIRAAVARKRGACA